MHKRFLISVAFALVGIAIILGIPTAYEGPLLLRINEQHSIRLADAVELALVAPSWLYLNLVLFRWWNRDKNCWQDKDKHTAH